MSDIQVTNYGICGECKYEFYNDEEIESVCTNEKSPKFLERLYLLDDTCECFEQRGME